MDLIVARFVSLLVVAILVAIIARRIRLPYTVGLVVTGIGLALARLGGEAVLTHGFIYDVILPPLLFEAALCLHWQELRRNALPVLTLAVGGVVISACVVASGAVWLLGWNVGAAAVFSVLIAATDPVSVLAMFKETGAGGRLRLLVESESLLNDGVAAVFFALALGWAQAAGGGGMTARHIASALAQNAGGGIAAGLLCGGAAIAIAGRTADHLIEAALTTVAAYGSFLLAEHFGGSGVLATVCAGLLMGNLGLLRDDNSNALTAKGRDFVIDFWEFAAFIANSIIFLLIGLALGSLDFAALHPLGLVAMLALVLLGRALSVYPICGAFAWSRWAVPAGQQHVLWWGGLRGALALALALSLPAGLSGRENIIVAAFAVVAFSVLVQGLSMKMLMRRLGLMPHI